MSQSNSGASSPVIRPKEWHPLDQQYDGIVCFTENCLSDYPLWAKIHAINEKTPLPVSTGILKVEGPLLQQITSNNTKPCRLNQKIFLVFSAHTLKLIWVERMEDEEEQGA